MKKFVDALPLTNGSRVQIAEAFTINAHEIYIRSWKRKSVRHRFLNYEKLKRNWKTLYLSEIVSWESNSYLHQNSCTASNALQLPSLTIKYFGGSSEQLTSSSYLSSPFTEIKVQKCIHSFIIYFTRRTFKLIKILTITKKIAWSHGMTLQQPY